MSLRVGECHRVRVGWGSMSLSEWDGWRVSVDTSRGLARKEAIEAISQYTVVSFTRVFIGGKIAVSMQSMYLCI
jgi:hypothetical protein